MSEQQSYKLLKADKTIIAETRANWLSQASDLDDFGVMVADDINNIFDNLEPETTDNEYTYFLIKNSERYGRAFLKIMHAAPYRKNESWFKLLKIRLEPNLNLEGKDAKSEDDATDMFEVLAAAIFESISLLFVNKIRTVKIYGRTEEMRSMFIALLANEPLKNLFSDKGLDARREGAWLVVEKQELKGDANEQKTT